MAATQLEADPEVEPQTPHETAGPPQSRSPLSDVPVRCPPRRKISRSMTGHCSVLFATQFALQPGDRPASPFSPLVFSPGFLPDRPPVGARGVPGSSVSEMGHTAPAGVAIDVDAADVDLLISCDDHDLETYLQRHRITVGYPLRGYKKALTIDIRNRDDNPNELLAEMDATLKQRRHHHDVSLSDPSHSFTHRIRIVSVDFFRTTPPTPLDPSLLSLDISDASLLHPPPPTLPSAPPTPTQPHDFEAMLDDSEFAAFETYRETLMELWYTEETYVQSLTILSDVYLSPLMTTKYASLVRRLHLQILQLSRLHDMFYRKLSRRINDAGDDVPLVGDLLTHFFHFVRLTCPFVVDYNANLKLINALTRHSSVAKLFEESRSHYLASHPGVPLQRIQSYLIVPIQRVPRYVLLVKVMLCNVPLLSPDTLPLYDCYRLILQIASWINEKKLFEEEREKYASVLRSISGLFAVNQSCRRYILSGVTQFSLPESTDISSAYFFLFNDVLIQTRCVIFQSFGLHYLLISRSQKVKQKQLPVVYRMIQKYVDVEDFVNDVFRVERVLMVTEEASVSYVSQSANRPALAFTSPLSDLTVTFLFDDPLDANAWFVALAYVIRLSPRVSETKEIFNIRND